MKLYVESSAVLSWLLGEPAGSEVAERIREASDVVSSDLTLAECGRAIVRLEQSGHVAPVAASGLRAVLNHAALSWTLVRVSEEILDRVARPFPVEPIRTLDALHLATALAVEERVRGLVVLSRDRRVRKNAVALGFEVLPKNVETPGRGT